MAGLTAIATIAVTITIIIADPRNLLIQWMDDHGYLVQLGYNRTGEMARLPTAWLSTRFSRERVPAIQLDIKFKYLQQLRARRAEALELGFLIQGEDDYVPATIRTGERSVRVKLRLKGDWIDQIERGAWSFRIRVRDGGHVFGLRRFSIHHPRVRNFHGEPLFLDAMRQEGVLAPRYFFVDVVLNGDFIGRMAVEEHFSKELLESQRRRESVILQFDESPLWNARQRGEVDTQFDFDNATVVPFRASSIAESAALTRDLRVATGLMRSFASGELPAREVFDARLMGGFLAVAEAWGGWHALVWHNMRFYYNPVTSRLEPLAFDGMVGDSRTPDEFVRYRRSMVRRLLSDSAVAFHYDAALVRMATQTAYQPRADSLAMLQRRYLALLRGHYPLLRPFSLAVVQARAGRLLSLWRGTEVLEEDADPADLRAYSIEDVDSPYLELANIGPVPLEVLRVERVRADDSIPRSLELSDPFPILLDGTAPGDQLNVFRSNYPEDVGVAGQTMVFARQRGESETFAVAARPYFAPVASNPIPRSDLDSILEDHLFLSQDNGNWLVAARGTWEIEETLALPEGVGLRLREGTTLVFSENASLVMRGPVDFLGTASAPVVLKGKGTTPEAEPAWQGIAVLGAERPSYLAHVEFHHTTGINQNGWVLTGGVTFYESEVHLDQVDFLGNRAEDALNLVRSEFSMNDVRFEDAISDALDIDFSQGTITGGVFRNVGWIGGGDAIDASGSRVTITDVRFERIGDKALSVGEGSSVVARNIWVDSAGVGAVSKDRSELQLDHATFENIIHAVLMAYVKKPEYGPATLEARGLETDQTARETWVQTGSTVSIDGRRAKTEPMNVDSLYNRAMAKGLNR